LNYLQNRTKYLFSRVQEVSMMIP